MKKPPVRNLRFTVSPGVIICLVLVLVTVAAYWQVYQFDFVRYDDDRYVLQNPHVHTGLKQENILWAFQSLYAGNWHPLTWISLMVDAQIFGLHAGGYHVVNLLFHILNTLLIFIVFTALTGAPWRSAAVAALFALHPLHVESVAWVAERKDVLSTFFLMLTLYAYLRYARTPGPKAYLPVVLFFALGLLAKPMLVTLPFVLLLMDYWPLKRISPIAEASSPAKGGMNAAAGIFGRLVYEKLPLFGLTAISIVLTLLAQRDEIATMQYVPIMLRISNALVSYCGYLAKTLWPLPLAVLYPHPEFIPLWHTIGAAAILVLITVLALATARRHPYFLVGWLWYLGTLVPVIGLIQVGVQSMADRYTYIPLIGIFIAAVWMITDLLTDRRGYRSYILPALCAAVAGFLLTVTGAQLDHWRNSKALFSHALSVTERNHVMHNNMGALMAAGGNFQEAAAHYAAALAIRPNDADAHYNLGNLLLRQGRPREAISRYREALRGKPDFAPAHNNMGIALGQSGDHEKAAEQFREALRVDPGHRDAQNNLALALARLEKPRDKVLSKASEIPGSDPETAEGQLKAGVALAENGDLAGAITRFREALKRNPDHYDANVHMGLSLALQRNFNEAIPHFRKAIQINPKRPEMHNSLGVALANTGRIDEAITQLGEALRIDPNFAKAHNSLGVLLAKSGKIDEGLSHLREAVKLQPDYQEARKNLEIVQGLKTGN